MVVPHVKRKTVLFYLQRIENGINPCIGTMRLDELKPEHIRTMQTTLLKSGQSASTVNSAHTTLSVALQAAVNDRKIAYNPAKSVKRLKVIRDEIVPLDPSEASAILWAVEGHRLEALYHLAFLGLRKGELLGIRVSDIDMYAGTLHIRQQVVELENSRMDFDTPKSDNAKRLLPLSPSLLIQIRQRLEMLLIERGAAGWVEHGLMFPSERGTIMTQRNLDRHLASTLATAGITRPWTWHKFRHTVVSWLTDVSVTNEIVKAIIGHGDKDVTDGYRHISLAPKREALLRLEQTYLSDVYEPNNEQIKDRAWRLQSATVPVVAKQRKEG